MAGKKLNPEVAGLARAVLLIDHNYGGEGRFVRPLLSIARTNLSIFKGLPTEEAAGILCRALNKLAKEKEEGVNYQEPGVMAEALEWATQTPDRRQ